MSLKAWRIEAACQAAWPTTAETVLDGWLLRHSGGSTRRLNALHPTRDGPRDPAPVLAAARERLAAAGKPLTVRVPAIATGLDAALDRLGFGPPEGETLTLSAPLPPANPPTPHRVALHDRVTPDWLALRVDFAGLDGAEAMRLHRDIGLVPSPARFALVSDDAVTAAGFGTIVDGWLVLESIVTSPSHRRTGHGRTLVTALMHWAAAAGAAHACLQVLATNIPAIALYRTLGFDREAYRYAYRVART
ncbi:GNAT family N-acetyltransferase [Sphingomonas sp.]|uniref:GNAT family N-acetyltransferase n=1 Tax=Sphingomonas sp. TaxID=28214 RepID=UPI003AFF7B69